MKILLISMPDTSPHFSPKIWKPPSLAFASIAGNLTGHDVSIADLVLKRKNVEKTVTNLLSDCQPDLVALTAMSFQFYTAKKIAKLLKSLNPELKIAIGGYHPTLMYKEICGGEEGEAFDFILRGEGDLSFGEMVEAIEGKREYEEVDGLSFKRNGVFAHNRPRPLEDLEKIKLPDRTKRIWKGYRFSGRQLDVVETSRGCTMVCNFCSMNRMYGRTFRPYKIERVMEDIAKAKEQGATFLACADDNITLDIERFETLCDAVLEAGHNDINYIIQASSVGISSSPDLVKKMARAGFNIVFLGIENVSEKSLAAMKKGKIVERTKEAARLLHENNILIVGGMIIGHAHDNEEEIAKNYEFFDEHDIDFFGDQIITPYPGTGMRETLLEDGLITNHDNYRRYDGYWANVRTNYLSSDELQFLRWKYRRKYSTFYKTTPTFKATHPWINLIRVLFLRPINRIKDFVRSVGKSEREMYEADMQRLLKTNVFFEE